MPEQMVKRTLHITNIQETFNTIYTHLIKQGCKSERTDGSGCLYRGPNGTKCAFGCLIPDDYYTYNWEDKSICSLMFLNLVSFETTELNILCATIQDSHDQYTITDGDWTMYINKEFTRLADFYTLSLSIIQ